METSKKREILTGPIRQVLFRLSLPLIFSNIVATLYSLADGVWLAQLSYAEFAATSLTWPILFLFISISIGISVAGTSIISQMIGANRKEEASKYANNLIVISIITGIIFSILGYFSADFIIGLMGAEGELYHYSVIYLKVNAAAFVVDNLYFAFQSILNAQGKTKETTAMGFISGILNIVLDPVFIFVSIPFINLPGFGFGVAGAAIATILAKIVAVIIGAVAIIKDKSDVEVSLANLKPDKKYVRNLFRLAIPTAIGRSSAALGFSVMNAVIVSFGQEVVAGFSMVNRTTDFWMQISAGIGSAMVAMIGQNMGAHQYKRARQVVKEAVKIVMISSFVGMIMLYFFRNPLLRIFVDPEVDTVVYNIALDYLVPIGILNVPFMGLFNVYQSLFQGTGQMKYSMHMSTGRLWVIRVPFVLFMMKFTEVGMSSIWYGMILSNVLIVLYSYYIYRSRLIIPHEETR